MTDIVTKLIGAAMMDAAKNGRTDTASTLANMLIEQISGQKRERTSEDKDQGPAYKRQRENEENEDVEDEDEENEDEESVSSFSSSLTSSSSSASSAASSEDEETAKLPIKMSRNHSLVINAKILEQFVKEWVFVAPSGSPTDVDWDTVPSQLQPDDSLDLTMDTDEDGKNELMLKEVRRSVLEEIVDYKAVIVALFTALRRQQSPSSNQWLLQVVLCYCHRHCHLDDPSRTEAPGRLRALVYSVFADRCERNCREMNDKSRRMLGMLLLLSFSEMEGDEVLDNLRRLRGLAYAFKNDDLGADMDEVCHTIGDGEIGSGEDGKDGKNVSPFITLICHGGILYEDAEDEKDKKMAQSLAKKVKSLVDPELGLWFLYNLFWNSCIVS